MSSEDPISVLHDQTDSAVADLKTILDEVTATTPRPLLGEEQSAEDRRAYVRRLRDNPALVTVMQDEAAHIYKLPRDRPVSKRLLKKLIAAARELREEDE